MHLQHLFFLSNSTHVSFLGKKISSAEFSPINPDVCPHGS